MPRRKAASPAPEPILARSVAAAGVPPGPKLEVTTMPLARGARLHRVHSDVYQGDEFNPGLKGNARFSPIKDKTGAAIPTLYAAATFEAAAMESVFHDVPHAPGFKQFDKAKLQGQVHSLVELTQDLTLADLSNKPLRKLGIERRQLIDTEKDLYPATRPWAEAIHAQRPDVQGLCWTSRQDDTARAVMLFGDRISSGALVQVSLSRSLVDDPQAYAELLDLAEVIGVDIVPGRDA